MSNFPENGVIFDRSENWPAKLAVVEFEKWLDATKQLPGALPPVVAVISNFTITPTSAHILVAGTEGNYILETISSTSLQDGAMIFLAAATPDYTITVRGSGNIATPAEFSLATGAWAVLQRSGDMWRVVNSLPLEMHKVDNLAHKPLFDSVTGLANAAQAAVNTVAGDLSTLSGKVENNITHIGSIEGAVSDLTTGAAALDGKVQTNTETIISHGTRITGAEGALSGLTSGIATLESTVAGHGIRITGAETRISTLETSSGTGDVTTGQMNTAIANAIAPLATTVALNAVSTVANAATPAARTITTVAPLTGGGNLSANRTLAVSSATTAAPGVVRPFPASAFVDGEDPQINWAKPDEVPSGGAHQHLINRVVVLESSIGDISTALAAFLRV